MIFWSNNTNTYNNNNNRNKSFGSFNADKSFPLVRVSEAFNIWNS